MGPRGMRMSGEGSIPRKPSPNIVRVIKCRRLTWAGHVARMEEGRNFFFFKILTGERRRMEGQY